MTVCKFCKREREEKKGRGKERKRECNVTQIAIGQKEQNFIFISLVLEDKVREVREIFWSHTAHKFRAEQVISIHGRKRRTAVCQACSLI